MIVDLIILDFIERPDYLKLLDQRLILWNGCHCRGVMLLIAHDYVRNQGTLARQESAAVFKSLSMPHL